MMLKKISLVAFFVFMATAILQAAPFMSHNSRRAPQTLIVVGNYKTPRLMAATIKGLTSQPYMVITNDGRYFLFMTRSTTEIPADRLAAYLNRLDPNRVVIIGDERYVTREQENALRQINTKRIPIIRIYGGDWGRIAEELDDLLNIGNLAREFRRNYFDLSMSDAEVRDSSDGEEPSALPARGDAPAAQPAGSDDAPVAEPDAL